METKVCKECGEQRPINAFRLTRWGTRADVCNECTTVKRRENKANKMGIGGGKQTPISDPDFDGKDPGEVVRMMGRAQRWLQSRGFTIRLDGEYAETKVHKLKF